MIDEFLSENVIEVDEIKYLEYIEKDTMEGNRNTEKRVVTESVSTCTPQQVEDTDVKKIMVSMQGNYVVIWYEDGGITLIPHHKILYIHTNLENKKNQKNR